MKKFFYLILAAGLSLAVSCQKEKDDVVYGVTVKNGVTTIVALLEGNPTKVTVDADAKVNWAVGDKIAVYSNSGSFIHSDALTTAGTSASFTFTENALDESTRAKYAVYPYNAADGDDLAVKYPSSYALTNLSSFEAPVVMVAKNSPGNYLEFKHVGSLVRLTVMDVPKGTDELKVIFDQDVTGSFSVDGKDTDPFAPYVTTVAATSKNVVSFTFSALAAMQDVVLNIPVPTATYGDIRVEAYAGGKYFPCGISFTAGKALTRKKATKLSCYMPVFSVSATKKVVFSPGNLVASTENSGTTWTWSFASNQYDLLSTQATVSGKMTISETSGSRDIFRWSTEKAADYGINAETADATYYDYVNDTFVDWGTNVISGYPANTWRTPAANLTYSFASKQADIEALSGRGELEYLFEERSASTITGLDAVGGSDQVVSDARYVKSYVCGIRAYVLFPDNFTYPADVDKAPLINRGDAWWRASYDAAAWAKMEAAGAVCLPCVNGSIYYYTSTKNVGDATGFGVNMMDLHYNYGRIGWGRPYQNYHVRLIRDAN